MGWAKGGLYYQRSVWRDGRVVSEYFGSGPAALAVSLLDEEERQARLEARAAALAAEAEDRRLFDLERCRGGAIAVMTAVCLQGLGYRKYDRHGWRRPMKRTELARRGAGDPAPPRREEIKALAARVRRKEPGAYTEFSRLAELHPAAVAAAMRLDLAELARVAFARKAAGENPALEVGLLAKMRALFEELAGDRPSPALQLASEVLVFNWAETWTLSLSPAHHGFDQATPMSLRRRQAAQRRYLASLRAWQRIAQIERLEERTRS
jgi:hypothetical protein